MSTIYGRKFAIRRGYLLVPQEMTGPGGKVYTVDLEYQLFDEDGAPVPVLDRLQEVQGELQGNRLVIGDPHRDTQLFDYIVDAQPTSESSNYWRGYQAALGDRQWHKEDTGKKYYANTQAWWDGYNQGHRDKRDPSAGYAPNPRKRGPAMQLGASDDAANRERGTSGRFSRSPPCDFCGKSCAAEHFTDDRAAAGSDGPGFYLCGRAACTRARERLEADEGFEALKRHYREQRSKNDAQAFLDGPRGTRRELTDLRRQQAAVAQMLRYSTDSEKTASLQRKERDLQQRVDKLAFPEHAPNMRDYNSRGIAGLVTRVGDMSIYVAEQAGIDADHETPWVVVCEKHGSMMPCATREQARATMDDPEWCEECAGYASNHSAVYHVWVLDYHGVPLDSEGPYGPYSLDRAKQFARISATEGEHDRAVSHGGNPDASTFEIVRRYRRGTGERIV